MARAREGQRARAGLGFDGRRRALQAYKSLLVRRTDELVALVHEAVPGHPVLQVVTGDGAAGHALCLAGVDRVALTGSPATGRKVMAACAERLTPVVLVDVPPDALVLREETFGPVLPVVRARDADQAVDLANANPNPYGLGAAVFAGRRADRIARALRSGMASVNSVLTFAGVPSLPLGGVGESGFGRPGYVLPAVKRAMRLRHGRAPGIHGRRLRRPRW